MPCGRDTARTMASRAEVATMRSRVPFPVGPTERAIKTLVAIPKGRRKRFTPKACKVLGSPKVPLARFLKIVDIYFLPARSRTISLLPACRYHVGECDTHSCEVAGELCQTRRR